MVCDYIFGTKSEDSLNYMRDAMLTDFYTNIEETPGFYFLPCFLDNKPDQLRWQCIGFIIVFSSIFVSQYIIIFYCGINMFRELNKVVFLKSKKYHRLQVELFRSLVFQVTAPTLIFYIPAMPILLRPYIPFEIDFQTGVLVASFGLYPPIDSIILMIVVTDYRKSIKIVFLDLFNCVKTLFVKIRYCC
ncbi:unnamed protein product [Caenorhabditis angaria]|uniref:7TM GPCR serpentine receptor class x (Srx) domain-containing protein n=1 Tax=Caenorhabditis angaria TaxID=860376 RepID=A0A9P1IXD6_9PELO|nr:unnamed protein product [Caenorhabditis angaria]